MKPQGADSQSLSREGILEEIFQAVENFGRALEAFKSNMDVQIPATTDVSQLFGLFCALNSLTASPDHLRGIETIIKRNPCDSVRLLINKYLADKLGVQNVFTVSIYLNQSGQYCIIFRPAVDPTLNGIYSLPFLKNIPGCTVEEHKHGLALERVELSLDRAEDCKNFLISIAEIPYIDCVASIRQYVALIMQRWELDNNVRQMQGL